MILEAIYEVNGGRGCSEAEINQFIGNKHKSLPIAHESYLSSNLQKLVGKGALICNSGNRYVLPTEEDLASLERQRKKAKQPVGESSNPQIKCRHLQMEMFQQIVQLKYSPFFSFLNLFLD